MFTPAGAFAGQRRTPESTSPGISTGFGGAPSSRSWTTASRLLSFLYRILNSPPFTRSMRFSLPSRSAISSCVAIERWTVTVGCTLAGPPKPLATTRTGFELSVSGVTEILIDGDDAGPQLGC